MKLVTKRLYFRPWTKKDIPDMIEMLNDKTIHQFTKVPYPYTRKDALKFFRRMKKERNGKHFGVFLKDDVLVGSISLHHIQKKAKKAEIGYNIHRNHRKNGYATEASERMLAYAFNRLKLNRVCINHVKENLISGRVSKKVGCRFEGILRKEIFAGDKVHDHVINSILREEYLKRKKLIKNR